MNYAFKMMAVVMALGMLVLQGCQTSNYKRTGNWYGKNKASQVVIRLSDSKLCQMAVYKNSYGTKAWDINMYSMHVHEAKRRGLNCGVSNSKKIIASNNQNRSNVSSWNNTHLCSMATSGSGNSWTNETHLNFAVLEAKRRGLDCGVKAVII